MSSQISMAKRMKVFKRDNGKCSVCGCKLHLDIENWRDSFYMQIDHIIPRRMGGADDMDNLRAICKHCNSTKGQHIGIDTLKIVERHLINASIPNIASGQRLKDEYKYNLISKEDIDMVKGFIEKFYQRNMDFLNSLINK